MLALEETVIQSPKIPVLHNVDVQQHPTAAAIRNILARQLYSPVRWTETIQAMVVSGVQHIVECGPGKVLTGLTRRIDKSLNNVVLNSSDAFSKAIDVLK